MDTKTLVLLGETDGFFEKEYMIAELKQLGWMGEVRVVEGVGHNVAGEKTKETREFVEAFWKALAGK